MRRPPALPTAGRRGRRRSRRSRAQPVVGDVAREWFARYLDAVVVPVLWLYGAHGLGLEAHQQNTLVVLDTEGWPVGGRYRDNQGYHFSEARGGGLSRWLPGAGRELGTLCPDDVIDERLGYYVGVNNVLGLVGAMGSQQLADERALLVTARSVLTLLLGLAAFRGRRIGVGLLRAVSGWQLETAERVVAEPDVRNERSVRAFEHAGRFGVSRSPASSNRGRRTGPHAGVAAARRPRGPAVRGRARRPLRARRDGMAALALRCPAAAAVALPVPLRRGVLPAR